MSIAGDENAIPESYRMANVVWLRGGRVKHHYLSDEDHDSPPYCEHDLQQPLHHLRVFCRNISHAYSEFGSPAAQYYTAASDAEADQGRGGSRIKWRKIDRLAKAVYGAPCLSQGRHRVPQRRCCGCDVLQRQRTLPAEGNGN